MHANLASKGQEWHVNHKKVMHTGVSVLKPYPAEPDAENGIAGHKKEIKMRTRPHFRFRVEELQTLVCLHPPSGFLLGLMTASPPHIMETA